MRKRKLWFAVSIVVLICAVAAGWYFGTTPQSTDETDKNALQDERALNRSPQKDASQYVQVTLKHGSTESVIRRFMDAYAAGDPDKMDALAADGAKHSSLVAAGLPQKLYLYVVMEVLPTGRCRECDGKSGKKSDHFHISANDEDGFTRFFVARLSSGKVTSLDTEPYEKPPHMPQHGFLARSDRLEMLKRYLKGTQPNTIYLDFYEGRIYKGYTEVATGDCADVGVRTFWRKEKGKWRLLMETQDVVEKTELDKLGVPEDVQKVVWGEGSLSEPTLPIKTIHDAVLDDDLEAVKRFVEKNPESVNARDDEGNTPLILAVEGAGSEYDEVHVPMPVVKYLLANGADLSARDKSGKTAFLHASGDAPDYTEVTKLLLKHGARIDDVANDGTTLLHRLVRMGPDGDSEGQIRFLVSQGANIDARDKRGWTPLHTALSPDLESAFGARYARLVIELGADVNARTDKGETPLDLAKRLEDWRNYDDAAYKSGKTRLIKFLVAHGAK